MTFLDKALEERKWFKNDVINDANDIIEDYCPCDFDLEDDMMFCDGVHWNRDKCTACWNREYIEYKEPCKDTTTTGTVQDDSVNHPSHYTQGMEAIDEMIYVFGKETVAHFCLCNVWKYRKRALHKNGLEDLQKSDWYMQKYWELMYGEQ